MIIGKIRICTVQGHEIILILFFKQHENYIKQKKRYKDSEALYLTEIQLNYK